MANRGQDEHTINQLVQMAPTDAAAALEANFKTPRAVEMEAWRLWNLVNPGKPGARSTENQTIADHLVSVIQCLVFGERVAA
jgi:hypothetical protein